MSSRIPLVLALVLASLAAPTALAEGEEVLALADEALAAVGAAESAVWTAASGLLPPEPSEEEAAHEHEERDASASHEDERASEPAPRAAPADERAWAPAPLAPVARLVPIPIADAGAAPRIDLGAITAAIPLGPLAPADAPSTARVAAPAASVAEAPSAPAAPLAEPIAAAPLALAATAAATAAAPAAGALWERFRRFAWLALLYSRIAKERLLDHASRERLLDAVRARPGLAVADLATTTGMPRNTVTYHMRVMEREGLVSSTRNGRNRLFFAPGSLPQRANADAFATLRHETTLAMARAIGADPGVDQKALCERVGVSPSLAHWHADRLVASGLVDKRREGRFVRYYPGAAFGIVDARSA